MIALAREIFANETYAEGQTGDTANPLEAVELADDVGRHVSGSTAPSRSLKR